MMRRLIILLGGMAIVLVGCSQQLSEAMLRIGSTDVVVELATTPATQQRGLSGRATLAEGHGMLFIFDQPKIQRFWMPEMHFPLDMLWISQQRVVGITADVPVPTTTPLQLYPSPQPVEWVLEVPAGWAVRHGIAIGDSVVISK